MSIDIDEDYALAAFAREHEHTITNALRNHAERMDAAANEARQGYEAIKDDPAARERQDAAIVTTEGLRMSAELFASDAAKARRVADQLAALIDGDGDSA